MIEFHGWVTLREAYREVDEDDQLFKTSLKQIAASTEDIVKKSNVVAMIVEQNGATNLIVNGNLNHADNRWSEIVELFHMIANIAVGSYGLLHFHNDEDAFGKHNMFQVYVLRKGNLKLADDIHLSPYFPKLEE
ncbi:Imm7 family immunity protein [Pseudaestuariivita rosea]|uniref:Imm7 family immunity protein n=1 Tax=Pseudaestuariivita rosea TaxID=2763263 RepID=UPI001ABBDF7A|nr:Imm7 family immunity protein [Pseudaestuariivita rosea]